MYCFYAISNIIPMFVSRVVFATIAVILCPFVSQTYLINRNLKMAMPELNFFQRLKTIVGIWVDLGLFFGEYFYTYRMSKEKISKMFKVNIDVDALNNNKKGQLFVSGHFANWEMALAYVSYYVDKKINVVFRKSNNQFIEKIIVENFRKKHPNINIIAKQDNAGLKIARALKNGEIVIILIDQNDRRNGILVDFFNIPAYTSATSYVFYKKFDIDVYYFYALRQKNNIFKFYIDGEKIEFEKEKITQNDFLYKINKKLETTVRKSPWQWFWVHDRWKKK